MRINGKIFFLKDCLAHQEEVQAGLPVVSTSAYRFFGAGHMHVISFPFFAKLASGLPNGVGC